MTYLEIVQEIAREVGEASVTTVEDATGITQNIANLVNKFYQKIAVQKEWWWLEATDRIRLFAKNETGTIATTAGSKVVTGTSSTWLTDGVKDGDLLTISGMSHTFEIESVASDTSLTTTTPITETKAAGTSYAIVRTNYDLPETFSRFKNRGIDLKTGKPINPESWDDFQKKRLHGGTTFATGRVVMYTTYGRNPTTGTPKIWPWRLPKDAQDIEISYVRRTLDMTLDSDEPLLPPKYHWALVDSGIYQYYLHIGDDARAAIAKQDVAEWMKRMLVEQDAQGTGDVAMVVDMGWKRKQYHDALRDSNNEAKRMVDEATL